MSAQQTDQTYDAALKQDLGALIDVLELPEVGKRFVRLRWLDQTLWAGRRAGQARRWYYLLRLVAIVGGVMVPALVSVPSNPALACATFVISLAVAISLAIEAFFRWGERWTHYRRMSEILKSEGWLYFQLAGPYQEAGSHERAYPEFARRVEAVIAADVDAFITQVAREKSKDDGSK